MAYESLKKNYGIWQNSYGKLSWEEYLRKLFKVKETGSWVKDVIKMELEEKR